MPRPTTSGLPLVVWIDHHKSIIDLISRLGQHPRSRTATTRLNEEFEFASLMIPTGKNLAERTIAKLKETFNGDIALILTDCTFGDHSDHEKSWKAGIKLATDLRQELKNVPVGIYSRFALKSHRRASISTKQFALVIEELTEIVEMIGDVSIDDLFDLLQEAIRTSRALSSKPLSTSTTFAASGQAKWMTGQPECSSPGFRLAALKLVEQTLSSLGNVPEILVTQIGGGFSGSFVVRADVADRKKSFIIKIDENPNRLEQELLGYKEIMERTDHDFWLAPFSSLETLLPDHWGAFAMQYESNATPLIAHIGLASNKLADVYTRLWRECLDGLYGNIEEQQHTKSRIVRDDTRAYALKAFQKIARYRPHVSKKCDKLVNIALKFLEGGDCFGFKSRQIVRVCWATFVHGDLNCRNVFFDEKRKDIRIIDFPNVKPNFLPTDYVKAEAELILILMDWDTGRDGDFGQLDPWKLLTQEFAMALTPKFKHYGSSEISRIASALGVIRAAYARNAKSSADAGEAYRFCLIARVLSYLSYSDITPAKRFLALVWIGQLLTANEAKWPR